MLPTGLQLDGEIYSPGADGTPDLHRLGARLLRAERGIAVTHAVFDLLAVDSITTLDMPYRERHALLTELELPIVCTVVESFGDPEALWEAVLELRLEGVVAKRERDRYRLDPEEVPALAASRRGAGARDAKAQNLLSAPPVLDTPVCVECGAVWLPADETRRQLHQVDVDELAW